MDCSDFVSGRIGPKLLYIVWVNWVVNNKSYTHLSMAEASDISK